MSDDPYLEIKRWRVARLVVLGLAGSSLVVMGSIVGVAVWLWLIGKPVPEDLRAAALMVAGFYTAKAWDTVKDLLK